MRLYVYRRVNRAGVLRLFRTGSEMQPISATSLQMASRKTISGFVSEASVHHMLSDAR